MKFVLVVEGETEAECAPGFLKGWLDKQLDNKVGIERVWLRGFGNFKNEIARVVQQSLTDPASAEIIAVIGLLDLYGLDIYPADVTSARGRENWGRRYFEDSLVRDERFRMFFAVHEFEAWILGHHEMLPRGVHEDLTAKAKTKPENVDFDRPPSHLLDHLYRKHLNRAYEKVKHGKNLFSKLDPEVVRDRCPRLKAMLDEMLKLAQDAGL